MVRYIRRLFETIVVLILLLPACNGIKQYQADLPGSKRIYYIMGTNKSPVVGTDMKIIDRWSYNTVTGELKLEKSDSSSSEGKNIIDSLKGLPLVVP